MNNKLKNATYRLRWARRDGWLQRDRRCGLKSNNVIRKSANAKSFESQWTQKCNIPTEMDWKRPTASERQMASTRQTAPPMTNEKMLAGARIKSFKYLQMARVELTDWDGFEEMDGTKETEGSEESDGAAFARGWYTSVGEQTWLIHIIQTHHVCNLPIQKDSKRPTASKRRKVRPEERHFY
jgi:hypothetical protein